MKKKIVSLALCLLSLNSQASDSEPKKQAAQLLQATAVLDMIKLSSPGLNPACLDKAWKKRSIELLDAYQQEYSLDELKTLNQFFTGWLGKRYIADLANQVRASKGLPVMQPSQFSEQDKQQVQEFFETSTGKKFSSGASAKRMNDVGIQTGMALAMDCYKK